MKTRLLSTISCLLTLSLGLFAQIPNGGFEDWVTTGSIQEPRYWSTPNVLQSAPPFVCERGTPGAAGASYAKITTRDIPGFGLAGMIFSEEFAYSGRPAALNGKWRYRVVIGDEAAIMVFLTKWNPVTQESDDVGGGIITVVGNASAWQDLSIRIDYYSSMAPDTAFIIIASSFGSPTVGSTLDVDDLSFGAYQSVGGMDRVELSVFPVPARDQVTVRSDAAIEEVAIWGSDGREVLRQRVRGTTAVLDVGILPSGLYVMRARMADGSLMHRTVVME